jgi:hypothetical protein
LQDDTNRNQWPTPINKPDLWRVAASILLGIVIAMVVVIFFL